MVMKDTWNYFNIFEFVKSYLSPSLENIPFVLEKNAYFSVVRISTIIVLKSISIFYESFFRRKTFNRR